MPKHRRRAHGLFLKPQRRISFHQTVKSLLNMSSRLILHNHRLEAIKRGKIHLAVKVIPPDSHFLSRQVVHGQVIFNASIASIRACRESSEHLGQSILGKQSHFLIAINIGYLQVIALRPQIISIRGVFITRVQLNKAIQRHNCVVILFVFIISISRHKLSLSCPRRIRMLPLNLIKHLSRLAIIFGLDFLISFIVKGFHRPLLHRLLPVRGARSRDKKD